MAVAEKHANTQTVPRRAVEIMVGSMSRTASRSGPRESPSTKQKEWKIPKRKRTLETGVANNQIINNSPTKNINGLPIEVVKKTTEPKVAQRIPIVRVK